MPKQVAFKDFDGLKRGGILLDNGDIICGCCGALCKADDRGKEWDIVIEYDG